MQANTWNTYLHYLFIYSRDVASLLDREAGRANETFHYVNTLQAEVRYRPAVNCHKMKLVC